MSQFIQNLEARNLFAFADDQMLILANAAAARAAFATASVTLKADVKSIATNLKAVTTPANRATNAALLKALKADVSSSLATIRRDGSILVGKCSALARKVSGISTALARNPGNLKLQAKLTLALPLLESTITTAMTRLQADFDAIDLAPELNAIAVANPSSAPLAAGVLTVLNNATTAVASLETAVSAFQSSVAILADKAADLPTGPYLVGTYAGTAITTAGLGIGSQVGVQIRFTAQGADGVLSGTVIITEPSGATNTLTLTGTVSATGVFTATATGTLPDEGATLSGTVSGTTITGTYVAKEDSGTFSIRRQ